jgi:hypothetical protein
MVSPKSNVFEKQIQQRFIPRILAEIQKILITILRGSASQKWI